MSAFGQMARLCLIGLGITLGVAAFGPVTNVRAEASIDCSQAAGALPNPKLPAGSPDRDIPIEHIVVIMQENHSFDMHFGRLNDPAFYGSAIDGITPEMFNLDKRGAPVHAYHEASRCIKDTDHSWGTEHRAWNNGQNDGFVTANGSRVMGFYDQTELPYYYALANQFAVGDRYFSSALSPTYPNRFFLMTGTAFGHIQNDNPTPGSVFHQRTIFDVLDQHKISWKYYADWPGYLPFFRKQDRRNHPNSGTILDYERDLKAGKLPQVVFLESKEDVEDEHPPVDVAVGERWVADRISSLMASSAWKNSVLFLTYDENGALYDHVAPPEACTPEKASWSKNYERLGLRVPFVAVSPFVKHHFVSHHTYDHTSILKFIETRYNLPALTKRDANADGMLELFDFQRPRFEVQPMPAPAHDPGGSSRCQPVRAHRNGPHPSDGS